MYNIVLECEPQRETFIFFSSFIWEKTSAKLVSFFLESQRGQSSASHIQYKTNRMKNYSSLLIWKFSLTQDHSSAKLSPGLPLAPPAYLNHWLGFFPLMTTFKRHFLWVMTSQCGLRRKGRETEGWRAEMDLKPVYVFVCTCKHIESETLYVTLAELRCINYFVSIYRFLLIQ